MARRRLEGLERVLGANALFLDRVRNVGSSIYYALGLVASCTLGPPVVFVITGFFFFCTAATYAEATTMYPRPAARPVRAARVQRVLVVLRGLGADAHLHLHDRHLGVLRAALHRRPVLGAAAPLQETSSSAPL